MSLTRVERERLTDSELKLRSVTRSLKQVNPEKIPHFDEIQECLEEVDESLKGALRNNEEES